MASLRVLRGSTSFNCSIASKWRNQIYGLAILWVVIFHGTAIDKVDYAFGHPSLEWLQSIIGVGNVGVDIFLFLSGISLYFSFQKESNAYCFIKKRLARLIPATLLIYSVYWFIHYCLIKGNFVAFASRLTCMHFWLTGDQTIWFVSLILVLYCTYPYIYGFLYSGNRGGSVVIRALTLIALSYGLIVLISYVTPEWYEQVEIALTRIPVFLMGCAFGKVVYEKKPLSPATIALFIFAAAIFAIAIFSNSLHGMPRRFIYAFGGIGFAYLFAFLFEALSRAKITAGIGSAFSKIGAFSLELYCAHIMVNQVLKLSPFFNEGSIIQYLGVIFVSLLVAFVASEIASRISKQLLRQ